MGRKREGRESDEVVLDEVTVDVGLLDQVGLAEETLQLRGGNELA